MLISYENKENPLFTVKSFIGNFGRHLHSQIELICVCGGTVKITIGEECFKLKKGDLALIFPNIPHEYFFIDENSIYMCIFNPECTEKFTNHFTSYLTQNPVINAESDFDEIIYDLDKVLKYTDAGANECAASYLQAALSHILPKMKLIKPDCSLRGNIRFDILKYISDNFTQDISLELLSRKFSVSRYYISHIISQTLSTNLTSFINEHRINYAHHLLITTDKTVTQVCEESGFQSQRTFNRVFKELTGIAPREYREKYMLEKI